MNAPLDNRETRIQNFALLWGFLAGAALVGLIWKVTR